MHNQSKMTMIRKLLTYLIIGYTTLFSFTSCNKIGDTARKQEVLNFDMNCNKDSSYFYYTLDYEKIYLDISTYCVTIKFSGKVTKGYLDHLIEKNSELDSISFINDDKNLVYGYLKKDICCEEIEDLLISLTLEDQILCANPGFYLIETIVRGIPINDKYDLIGLTDEFIVKLKEELPYSILESLISQTHTKLIEKKDYYSIVSANKYSDRNCLEMSRYFYETGYFEYSHPDFLMNVAFGN